MITAVAVTEPAAPPLTPTERATVTALNLTPPPPSPSNAVADDPRAAAFGRALFFDPRLSGDGARSCAGCHQPQRAFTDGEPLGRANDGGRLLRNTPTLFGAAYQPWLYWDGRRDSLWAQALVPLETDNEMASDRVAIVRYVGRQRRYRSAYETLFGGFPRELLGGSIPPSAGPFGAPETRRAWQTLNAARRASVNRVFSNIGKAIAAFERTLRPGPTLFDRFAALPPAAQTPTTYPQAALSGLRLFIDPDRTHCLRCHNGPAFSDGGFHNVGTGTFTGNAVDIGRELGLRVVLRDPFNCLGPYSDARPEQCQELRFLNADDHGLTGAFRTPSLRLVADTAPYFHDGRFATLRDVLRFYNDPPPAATELFPLRLSEQELDQLEAFLNTLSLIPASAAAPDKTSDKVRE